LMKECYDFLKNHMKREITKKDYDTEDEDIDSMIVKYKWSCRGY
jgi:predicted HTH domain antitoxin